MEIYPIIPLAACVISACTAVHLWMGEPDNRRMRPIAGISGLGAWWAFCEVLWNQADDPASARFWMELSSLGWAPLGPMALHALAVVCDLYSRRVRFAVWTLHAAALFMVGLTLSGDAMVRDVVRTAWGWSLDPGPAMIAQYFLVLGAALTGYRMFRSRYTLEEERTAAPLVTISFATPIAIASITDVILPSIGVHEVPRLGTAAIAFIGVLRGYNYLRHGDSLMLPEGITAQALQALPDGVVSVAIDGRIRTANGRMARLIGCAANELSGRPISDFLPEILFAPLRELRDQGCKLTVAGDDPIEVSVSASLREVRGETAGAIVIVRDEREVANLRNRLLLSGRMAAVGELAAGIAHELNNPIAYVRSNLSVLRENADLVRKELRQLPNWKELETLASECEEAIDESLEGIDRAASIVRDVREFSHAGDDRRTSADLAVVIEQSVRVARIQIANDVVVELSLPPLPMVECDVQRMKQVFVNLLVNAGQAVSEGGQIEVGGETSDSEIAIRVRDNGSGIPPADLDRIFDPFFTTKPVGVGTGLGLAIAFGIVQDHGGSIEVDSTEGVGTEFTIRLPRSADDAAAD